MKHKVEGRYSRDRTWRGQYRKSQSEKAPHTRGFGLRLVFYGLVAAGMISAGCHKKGQPGGYNCPPCPLYRTYVKFRIVDKQTGQDYFFSNTPKYPVSAIHVENVKNPVDSLFYFSIDSNQHVFAIIPINVTGQDPAFYAYSIIIDGLGPDTLRFETTESPAALASNTIGCCVNFNEAAQITVGTQSFPDDYPDTAVLVIQK